MPLDSVIYGYIAEEEVYQPNTTIIEEGKRGDWVYVVLEGRVKIKKATPKGPVTLDILGEGAIVGEMVLLKDTKEKRTASVVADGVVKMGILDRERLESEYESLSPQLKGLIKTLVFRLEETTKRASALAAEQVPEEP